MPRHERRVVRLDHRYGTDVIEGIVVRNFRLLRNWTQAEAAEWYGVSTREWQRYEAGHARVPRPLRKRIEAWTRTTVTGADNAAYLSFSA